MNKLTSNMMKTVQDMFKNSKDISISTISPILSDGEFQRFLTDLKTIVSKNKSKTITIVVSIN